jgi:hypothetical protein
MADVLATRRSPPRRVSVILSAAVCFALTCLAWWQIGRPGVGDPVLIARTLYALVYVLFAWGAASAITLGIYLAICTGDFNDLLLASLLASLPAAWLVPAILLLSTPRPIAVAGGLLLIANSARLLFSHRVPHRYARARTRPSRQVPGSLFATADRSRVSPRTFRPLWRLRLSNRYLCRLCWFPVPVRVPVCRGSRAGPVPPSLAALSIRGKPEVPALKTGVLP